MRFVSSFSWFGLFTSIHHRLSAVLLIAPQGRDSPDHQGNIREIFKYQGNRCYYYCYYLYFQHQFYYWCSYYYYYYYFKCYYQQHYNSYYYYYKYYYCNWWTYYNYNYYNYNYKYYCYYYSCKYCYNCCCYGASPSSLMSRLAAGLDVSLYLYDFMQLFVKSHFVF